MIDLGTWIERKFEGSKKPPSVKTVYRWISLGKIHPMPQKKGRRYYFEPHADYFDDPAVAANVARIMGNGTLKKAS